MSARNDRNRQHLVGKVADALRARIAAQPAQGSVAARARNQRGGLDLRKRLLIVAGVLGLGSLALVVRAFDVQVVNNDFYLQQGQARSLREIPIPTSRGMITDRNGEPLAVSTPVESVWANPKELLANPARIPELAAALGVPADVLTRKLSQRANKEFLYLKRRISPEQARRILAHNVPGVFSQREFRRFYPQGEAMAHVLGFTNVDDRGQEGLELSFDHILSGKPGSKRVIRDGQGRIVESVDLIKAAEPGQDLTLTIDRRIQFLAYRELRNQLTKTGASSGSAVILDVATGEVLAMVNLPSFNPNAAAMGNIEAHRNRAVTDVFEPGSTMKPITVAAALNARIVTPNTRIDLNPGWMALDRKYTIRDHSNYGVQTVTGIITKSSNIGAAKLAARMDDKYFYDFVHQFGYGQKPGSGFPGESSGVLTAPGSPSWYGTTKATMSYGYGMSATPLQIAMVYAALGNGGKLIRPTFVKGERHEPKQVLDPQIAHEVMRMMQTVTETGGTATQAAILGYHVAGKTGTARKFSETGGYTRRYLSYFAGVVPVQNPRFSMVVIVNDPDPERGYFGGLVSAPVFRSVMDGALRLMDVPPDDIDTWMAAQTKAQHANELRGEEGPVLPDATAAPLADATLPTPVSGGAQ
ncbi:peptidoglycan D,D-transpeptidase FtsI family protein [Lysobacter solisilvae (ex Woo and Kim 2020)]|uniref:Peptidoglycan D,D-transpeptidase FtsI n=1 Tax=Agrilutibacter terrestris TaxID=2865112 RepID=A0A7H0FZ87_9GAMM|nr:penicillin-binding protein 2 [Lysobacter terrestris]QNP41353.1 penicillin-binding protein 2 [Lysobacter terrestris]